MGRAWRALAPLLAVLACLHAFTLERWPEPLVDEMWFGARAWFFKDGFVPFSTLDAGVFDRLPGWQTFFCWIPAALQSLVYLGARAPTLLPLRYESLALGLLLLVEVFVIARTLHGDRAGLIAIVLLGLSAPFFESAHLARYDIHAVTLGYGALAIDVATRHSRVWPGVLAGLLAILALDSHPNGIVIAAAFPALLAVDYRSRLFRRARTWALLAGASAGTLVYALLHVVRYPRSFAEFNRLAFGPTHTPPLFTGDFAVMQTALVEFAADLHTATGMLLGLAVISFGLLAIRRSESDLRLLALCAAIMLSFALLVRNKLWYYEIYYWPCIAMPVAALVEAAFAGVGRSRLHLALAGTVVVGCALATAVNLPPLGTDNFVAQAAAERQVAELVRPGDRVLAKQSYWFALHDHVYYSYEGLKYYQRYVPGASLEQAFAAFRPDIFILDTILDWSVTDAPGPSLYAQNLSLSRTELLAILRSRAKVVGRFRSPLYGDVIVFRLRWDDRREDSTGALTPGVLALDLPGAR